MSFYPEASSALLYTEFYTSDVRDQPVATYEDIEPQRQASIVIVDFSFSKSVVVTLLAPFLHDDNVAKNGRAIAKYLLFFVHSL